jgi:hypothetical protein
MPKIDENTMHIVCFSGGHSSALVAVEVARRYGTEKLVLLNHDINARVEDQDIKRFKVEVAAHVGVPITYANYRDWDTMDQFDVCIKHSAFKIGATSVLCTHRLKTEPFHDWLEKNMAPEKNCVVYYGFDKGEKVRMQRRSSILGEMGYQTDYPLALWERTIQSTEEIGIEPPLTYGVFRHANCTGCLKAGRQHWYVVYCTRPDIWEKAKKAEEKIDHSILRNVFLEELEPEFARMKDAGVEPTEKVPAGTFWAQARDKVEWEERDNILDFFTDEAIEEDSKPCECVV